MPDDDRARRRRVGGDALQAARAAHPVRRELADLLRDVGRRGGDGVVVVRLDAHHPRRLGGAEADREDGAERDRHLAEDVAGVALADHALDPVDELDRLDAALEHGEERALVALVRRVLARDEADVGRRAREPLALVRTSAAKIAIPAISSAVTIGDETLPRRRPRGDGPAAAGAEEDRAVAHRPVAAGQHGVDPA